MLREACAVPPSGRAGERGGLPPHHLASSIPLHCRIILTPSAMQPGTLGIVRGWLGLARSLWETLRLLSCSRPGSRGQKQQGTTPSPCPLLSCQEEALPRADGEEESHVLFWECPLAFLSPGLCTVQWFP